MTWGITLLVPGLAEDFPPATLDPFLPASRLVQLGPLLGEGEVGRQHCHKATGHCGFSGDLPQQGEPGWLPPNVMSLQAQTYYTYMLTCTQK